MGQHYNQDRQAFSTEAHYAALDLIYPRLLPGCDYSVESVTKAANQNDPRAQALDCYLGIDYLIHLHSSEPTLRAPLPITVQERFREPKYAHYQDVTLTEWNPRTSQLGEIYKIAAQWLLYAYYDPQDQRFLDAICIKTADLIAAFSKRQIIGRHQAGVKAEQSFISFSFADLHRVKAVVWHMTKSEPFMIGDMLQSLHSRLELQYKRMHQQEQLTRMVIDLLQPKKQGAKKSNVIPFNQESFL